MDGYRTYLDQCESCSHRAEAEAAIAALEQKIAQKRREEEARNVGKR